MTTLSASHLVLAQTAAEYGGLLDAIASGLAAARTRIELALGAGNTKFVLIGALLLLVLLLARRRR